MLVAIISLFTTMLVATHAPPICFPSTTHVFLLAAEGVPISPLNLQNGCAVQFVLDGEELNLKLVIQGAAAAGQVALPSWLEGATEMKGTDYLVQLQLKSSLSQEVPLEIRWQDSTVHTLTVQLIRRPRVSFQTPDNCGPAQICPAKFGTTVARLTGTNLGEIDLLQSAAFVAFDQPLNTSPASFQLRRDETGIGVYIPENRLVVNKQYVVITRRRVPRMIDATNRANSDTLMTVTVSSPSVSAEEIRFNGAKEYTLYLGESFSAVASADILPAALMKPNAILKIVEDASKKDRPVGFIHVLNTKGSVRVSAAAATMSPIRRDSVPQVLIYDGEEAIAHTHLQVLVPPQITTVRLTHPNGVYTDSAMHPGERIQLTLMGNSLSVYDTIHGSPGILSVRPTSKSNRQIDLEVDVAGDARNVASLTLGSRLTRDTVIHFVVAPNLRPRALQFAWVRYRPAPPKKEKVAMPVAKPQVAAASAPAPLPHRPALIGNESASPQARSVTMVPVTTVANGKALLDSLSFDSAVRLVGMPKLKDIAVHFDRSSVDPAGQFGPQYLRVDIAYFSPDHTLKARDTLQVVVANPATATIAGYDPTPELSINEILKDRLRFSKPGAYVDVAISHDPARYQVPLPTGSTIRLRNNSRWTIQPKAAFLSGIMYVGQVNTRQRTVEIMPNGPTADTLVRYRNNKDVKIDFFDVTGAAAAAVDFRRLNDDFKPGLLAFRLALMVARDPFSPDRPRRFGLGALYPVELLNIDGQVDLSVSFGGGCFIGSRCFGVIAPGVNFTIPGT